MTIPQRILLQVAAAGLANAAAMGVAHGILLNSAKQRELNHLKTYVMERARRIEVGLHGGLLLPGAGVFLFATLQLLRRAFLNFNFRRFRTRLGRWRHWEFWPAWMFYPPVGIYCAWLALKYRGLTVPTAANPGIFSGGFVSESKLATLQELFRTSPGFTAEAELVDGRRMGAESSGSILLPPSFCQESAPGVFAEPFILKPDLGQRGAGIKLIRTREQMQNYLRQMDAPLLAQRYAPGPHEVGIFYYRFPHETRGRICAITEKIFPVLIGDGRSTISELIRSDPRARFIADKYLQRFSARQDEVLAAGATLKQVESGNHAQGCIFRDGPRLWSPELEAWIDSISRQLTGFFIGRYDIRFASEGDLHAGKNFQIIELNGAASEATNICNARNSLWTAYRTPFRQWGLVFAIGAANRKSGCVPTKASLVWQKWREYARLGGTYPAAD